MLSLDIPPRKLLRWFRRPQLWATVDWQVHHDHVPTHHVLCTFFVKHQITQVTQPPYKPHLASCDFCLSPKPKAPLKRKRFQTVDEIQKNMTGLLMATGRIVWGPKVPTLKRTEAPSSCVQWFLYLVSSSINVSIFHITWLDTFWTDIEYRVWQK